MILGLHHVAICVPDIRQAISFYCGILGFTEFAKSERDGNNPLSDKAIGIPCVAASIRMIKAGPVFIELWQYRNPAPRPQIPERQVSDHGYTHICLQVQDIEAEHLRLSSAGMCFVGPPVHYGAISAVYGRDPFGNIVEIYEVHDAADENIASIL